MSWRFPRLLNEEVLVHQWCLGDGWTYLIPTGIHLLTGLVGSFGLLLQLAPGVASFTNKCVQWSCDANKRLGCSLRALVPRHMVGPIYPSVIADVDSFDSPRRVSLIRERVTIYRSIEAPARLMNCTTLQGRNTLTPADAQCLLSDQFRSFSCFPPLIPSLPS